MSVKPPAGPPNCLRCRHFRVSWDARFPRACRVFEIKSRELPSLEVYRATGTHCPSFELSPKLKGSRR
jgi:hypothetical protein